MSIQPQPTDKLSDFQDKLALIKLQLENLFSNFNIKDGIDLHLKNGKLYSYIDVEKFR